MKPQGLYSVSADRSVHVNSTKPCKCCAWPVLLWRQKHEVILTLCSFQGSAGGGTVTRPQQGQSEAEQFLEPEGYFPISALFCRCWLLALDASFVTETGEHRSGCDRQCSVYIWLLALKTPSVGPCHLLSAMKAESHSPVLLQSWLGSQM